MTAACWAQVIAPSSNRNARLSAVRYIKPGQDEAAVVDSMPRNQDMSLCIDNERKFDSYHLCVPPCVLPIAWCLLHGACAATRPHACPLSHMLTFLPLFAAAHARSLTFPCMPCMLSRSLTFPCMLSRSLTFPCMLSRSLTFLCMLSLAWSSLACSPHMPSSSCHMLSQHSCS
jgi:hypothetical protein